MAAVIAVINSSRSSVKLFFCVAWQSTYCYDGIRSPKTDEHPQKTEMLP